MKAHVRAALSGRALRIARRLGNQRFITLDFPPASANRPRYGHGRPPHPRLERLLASYEEGYRANLELLTRFRDDLVAIPRTGPADKFTARWLSPSLPPLDAATLYAFIRSRAPRRFLEVGAGVSTAWARRAISDVGLPTTLTSIDPAPWLPVEELCDELVRVPLEDADLAPFGELEAGDIVLMDGTHRAFMNSDATTFFLDVLPELASGVLVGIHDVFLPEDYLPQFGERFYSEQYLLAAYLLGGGAGLKPELPCHYVSDRSDLMSASEALWGHPAMEGLERIGFFFWLSKT